MTCLAFSGPLRGWLLAQHGRGRRTGCWALGWGAGAHHRPGHRGLRGSAPGYGDGLGRPSRARTRPGPSPGSPAPRPANSRRRRRSTGGRQPSGEFRPQPRGSRCGARGGAWETEPPGRAPRAWAALQVRGGGLRAGSQGREGAARVGSQGRGAGAPRGGSGSGCEARRGAAPAPGCCVRPPRAALSCGAGFGFAASRSGSPARERRSFRGRSDTSGGAGAGYARAGKRGAWADTPGRRLGPQGSGRGRPAPGSIRESGAFANGRNGKGVFAKEAPRLLPGNFWGARRHCPHHRVGRSAGCCPLPGGSRPRWRLSGGGLESHAGRADRGVRTGCGPQAPLQPGTCAGAGFPGCGRGTGFEFCSSPAGGKEGRLTERSPSPPLGLRRR